MAEALFRKHKRSMLFVLAAVILLSFFYWASEEASVGMVKRALEDCGDQAEEFATLTDGAAEAVGIQNAKEVSAAVYHANLIHKIAFRNSSQELRLRICFYMIALLGIACFLSWEVYDSLAHLFQGRIVLIRFIHNSDGKK